MKTFRFIYLAVIAVLISSCQAEIWEPASQQLVDNFNSFELAISSDDLITINPISKADNIDQILSKINDLNIKISLNSGNSMIFFCKPGSISVNGKQLKPDNKTEYIDGSTFDQNKIRIHFDAIKSTDVKKIEVIANAGNDLTNKDWNSVTEVGAYNPTKGYCMMYGTVTTASKEETHKGQTAPCKQYEVKLKRSRAMVSVKMINAGLKPGVEIKPTAMRICNIPEKCLIQALDSTDSRNKIQNNDNVLQVEKPLGYGVLGTNTSYTGNTLKDHLGEHDDITPIREDDFFFIFENKQGTNPNPYGKNHTTKYPKGVTTADEAKVAEKIHNYTYLEIEAEYLYRNVDNNKVKFSGTIVYRFFLGENEYDDFNIIGNHYYRINLNLKGLGGASENGQVDKDGNLLVENKDKKGDVSWRVDMNVKDWGFTKDQFDFDSHYLDGYVDVVGQSIEIVKVKTGDGYSSWLMFNIQEKWGTHWANPATTAMKDVFLKVVNGRVRFNLQPMIYGDGPLDPDGYFNEQTYKQAKNYREMTVTVQNEKGQTQDVVVRQYAPIPVPVGNSYVFMERFEEYPEGVNADGYEWGWYDNDLSTGLKDFNGNKITFKYGDVGRYDLTMNTIGLSSKYKNNAFITPSAKGCAADICNAKGQSGVAQGAAVSAYCLPSVSIFNSMIEKAKTYTSDWGPFQPINIYEDYWTSTVPNEAKKTSYFYQGSSRTSIFTDIESRKLHKRVRAVYDPQKQITSFD